MPRADGRPDDGRMDEGAGRMSRLKPDVSRSEGVILLAFTLLIGACVGLVFVYCHGGF